MARIVSEPPSHVAGRTEELLRGVQGAGVDATREDPAAGGCCQVVGTAESGDAVEDDHDVFALLDQSLGLLDRELGDVRVLVAGSVERAGDDLALDGSAHVGDFFRSLVDQQHHQLHCGMVVLDRRRDRLHDRRLASLRRRNDDAALTLADRRHEVDDAGSHVVRIGSVLEVHFSSGNSAVRSSNRGRAYAFSGSIPLTEWISSIAGFFSLRPAGRLRP